MKNLPVIGFLCITILLGACSKGGLKGYYVGSTEISGSMPEYSDGAKTGRDKRYEVKGEDVYALVTEESGTRTFAFAETNLISNCKLKVDSLSEGPQRVSGQTCEITLNGQTQHLTVFQIATNRYLGDDDIRISFTGESKETTQLVDIVFTGKPSAKK